MFNTSVIELNRTALRNNVEFIRNYLREGCRFSSVIKGNAYGHGIPVYVPLAEECGVEHFSVFSAGEAWQAQKVAKKGHSFMIMGATDRQEMEWAVQQRIDFFVSDPGALQDAIESAGRVGKKARIHLELETGMNRTGFEPRELRKSIPLIKKASHQLTLAGICTHFAGAESIANYHRIQNQKKAFRRMVRLMAREGLESENYHTACSAAALRYPETQMDMVRIGILQYGFFPTREILIDYMVKKKTNENPVHRILTWKSRVMGVKRISKGSFVGYGTSFLATNDMMVAAIPVGYAQGFSRSMSNRGHVLIRGERAAVVGMVNMNMMLVDVTHIGGTEKGDEVILIGRQGEREITVASFGEISEQVNYELLTRLPECIPRIVTD
ncbi:MAG TPA: alanine racemase [Bacteroidetes bacterium]|nr:alanine racemase [Bacteroidota bacterium]